MLGFSVFLGEDLTADTQAYIKNMSKQGFTGIFTSLHIPEDDATKYAARLTDLGALAQELKLDLMVDISTKALNSIGLDVQTDLLQIKKMGITGLRMDYGISMETIATISNEMTVGLNASTLTENDVALLKYHQADFEQMELWHNYYPRPETGLAREHFIEKNNWLHNLGLSVIAFVPGDGQLRGPLFEHLPTLEEHRTTHPLAAAIDLLDYCQVDAAYVGDSSLTYETRQQFSSYFSQATMSLRIAETIETHAHLFIGTHTNRVDDARDVVRSQDARFKEIPLIEPENTATRSIGSVTLDNTNYARYMGELQICKTTLPADPKVNVVATIISEHRNLINYIKPGQHFTLYKKGETN
ncbi:DUF871 domain-containing protein [Vagococcus intermedius]|uniref:MupG family TIM beta-alpha barrel fold protein n=1 Tax=Vagococcus intermedius TaxID=2991418 RepID=A0AAF0CV79_9ENTE|nr:MupG family TIM beta-alpha barrel fold protein [Vagococcus intermedius]WEG73523.1 MupG family TIM beta-alpha barrel fold protein [Vagococcus intermedius]WEG75605.1 MupG family TIM beta-alpha barrel fold protein [Vagococcus intermedius]